MSKKDKLNVAEAANPEIDNNSEASESAEASTDINNLHEMLQKAQQEIEQKHEAAVRLQAEIENVHKRTERRLEDAHRYAIEKFATELLGVVDSLEHGIATPAEAAADLRQGMELTLKLLLDTLQKFNVEVVNPEGDAFDPKLHEAMSMQESSAVAPGAVLNVIQKGFKLHDRLLRPARVIVAKAAAESGVEN